MKCSRLFPAPVAALILMAAAGAACADEIAVPVGQQGAEKASIARPKAGMTKARVEKQFGAPASCANPVGKPPVSHCDYPDYTVYYENNLVIHAVLKATTDEADAPAAAAPESAPAH